MSLGVEPVVRVGVVVTFLRMDWAPSGDAPALPAGAEVRYARDCSVEQYRFLYNTVGAQYVWWLRRAMPDRQLAALLRDTRVGIYVLHVDGEAAGFYELDSNGWPAVNLGYFGLMPQAVGRGFGYAFLRHAVDTAWKSGARALTVNTCTADHPRALPCYLRAGFRVTRRVAEEWNVPTRLGLVIPRRCVSRAQGQVRYHFFCSLTQCRCQADRRVAPMPLAREGSRLDARCQSDREDQHAGRRPGRDVGKRLRQSRQSGAADHAGCVELRLLRPVGRAQPHPVGARRRGRLRHRRQRRGHARADRGEQQRHHHVQLFQRRPWRRGRGPAAPVRRAFSMPTTTSSAWTASPYGGTVTFNASAVGGGGGEGAAGGTGGYGGSDGTYDGAPVTVDDGAQGGDGGGGGAGGEGGAVTATINALSLVASQAASFQLIASSLGGGVGGDGGGGGNGGTPGAGGGGAGGGDGGDATATFSNSNLSDIASVTIDIFATGGDGGRGGAAPVGGLGEDFGREGFGSPYTEVTTAGNAGGGGAGGTSGASRINFTGNTVVTATASLELDAADGTGTVDGGLGGAAVPSGSRTDSNGDVFDTDGAPAGAKGAIGQALPGALTMTDNTHLGARGRPRSPPRSCDRHRPAPMTATRGASRRSSSAPRSRPSSGRTRKRGKKSAVTSAVRTATGTAPGRTRL